MATLSDLDAMLARLASDVANEAAAAAVGVYVDELQAAIHREIDAEPEISEQLRESLHETVGARIVGAGSSLYQVGAKVGFGVGRSRRKRRQSVRRNKSGVGLSANNVHWFVLGTRERSTRLTGNRRRYAGRLMPIRVVVRAMGQVDAIRDKASSAARQVLISRGAIQGR